MMNRYRITIKCKGNGTVMRTAPNPQAALRQIHSFWEYGIDFVPANETKYDVMVELVGGTRKSVSYYRVNRR